jgi:hypothetical protein
MHRQDSSDKSFSCLLAFLDLSSILDRCVYDYTSVLPNANARFNTQVNKEASADVIQGFRFVIEFLRFRQFLHKILVEVL